MSIKTRLVRAYLVVFLGLFCCGFVNTGFTQDISFSVARMPNLAESAQKGYLIELLKVIEKEYTGGSFDIKVYPFQRSLINISKNRVDVHIPLLRNPLIPTESLPFDFLSEIQSEVNFVLYTNAENVISRQQIQNASYVLTESAIKQLENIEGLHHLNLIKNERFANWEAFKKRVSQLLPKNVYDKSIMAISIQAFPYRIETDRGHTNYFTFPTAAVDYPLSGLKRLAAKRSDAFLFANLADEVIKEEKIKNIHRELYQEFDAVFLTQKGAEGEKVDRLLSPAIKRAKNTPEYKKLINLIAPPYSNWQPHKMGW